MNLDDFKNIDFKNLASLPWPVKSVFLLSLGLVLLFAGYWFLWSPSLDDLEAAKQQELELRQVFLDKKRQAINLEAYKKQMIEIEQTFGALLRQLPDKSQMDALLTDINQTGVEQGLEFELFKPGKEVIAEFYAEMPISIKVSGTYHNIGNFAAGISRLSRIVTINDIAIGQPAKDGNLSMEAVAKTYRYLDAKEISGKKKS